MGGGDSGERELGTVRRSRLQSQCSHAAWRRPGCHCWVAKKGYLPVSVRCQGSRRRSPTRRGGRSPTPLGGKRRRERARPPYVSKDGREMRAQRGRWRPALGLPAEAGGERHLKVGRTAESGSAPASRGAPDRDSRSAAARPEPLGCVLWSSADCLPASPRRQQSLSQTPGTGLALRFRDLRLIKLGAGWS